MRAEFRFFTSMLQSQDLQEGRAAWAAKRAPDFKRQKEPRPARPPSNPANRRFS